MNDKSFNSLEFNKIKERLSKKCVTYLAKKIADNLTPSTCIKTCRLIQKETSEAVSISLRKGALKISSIPNIDNIFNKINQIKQKLIRNP